MCLGGYTNPGKFVNPIYEYNDHNTGCDPPGTANPDARASLDSNGILFGNPHPNFDAQAHSNSDQHSSKEYCNAAPTHPPAHPTRADYPTNRYTYTDAAPLASTNSGTYAGLNPYPAGSDLCPHAGTDAGAGPNSNTASNSDPRSYTSSDDVQ